MQFRISLLLAVVSVSLIVAAQPPASQKAKASLPPSPLQPLVAKQFGADFKVDAHFAALYGDFDGDGAEDIALVAITKNPLGGAGTFNYKVSDPYDGYFGVGNPKITTAFATFGDGSGHCILIIHNWKTDVPKAKWVIVNVPFSRISTAQATLKKKPVAALATVETNGMSSLVFFDGHKYRWEPNDFGDDADN